MNQPPNAGPRSEIRNPKWRISLLAVLTACQLALGASGEAPRAANGPAPPPLAVEKAFDDLKSDDWILKWAAMSQLARWKIQEAVPPIKAVLTGRDHPWVRGRALVALANLQGEQALDQAIASSKDAAPELRAAAVEALGVIGSPRGEAAIAERLKDPVPQVRHQAIVAFAGVRRERAWDTVAPLLADADPVMVQHATRALTYIATPEAQAKMMALLGHENGDVRVEAATALSRVRVPEAIPLLLYRMACDGDARMRVACEKALASFEGKALMLPLLAALIGQNRDQYAAALRVLAQRPTHEACEGVAALIRDPDEAYKDVLPDAFNLLTRLDPDRYQDIFVLYAGYYVAYVRAKAAEAIGLCKKADHFKLLRPLLVDRDHTVRVAAFRILRETTEGAPEGGIVPYLAEALQLGDKWTRRTASDLLGERIAPGDVPAAINVLATVLGGKDKEDRAYVAKALARAGDDAARRRIAQAQGYVTDWMLIGPFPRDNRNKGMGPSYFPEHEIDFAKTYPPFATDPGASFRVADAACGGQTKKSLCIQPPPNGRAPAKVVATFRLELPDAADLKLVMSLGIQGTSKETDGVEFGIDVDGTNVFEHKVTAPDVWEPASVALADHKGKKVAIDLVVDPLANPKDDRAVVGEPRLVTGGQTITNLTEIVETAPVRVVVPGAKGQMAWQPFKVNHITGEVPLYDIFPPPIYDKVAYGVADVAVAEEHKARLWIKSDDGFVLWLNGAEVKERSSAGEERVEATLRQGGNRIVIKVSNQRDWWRYELRLSDADDRALTFRQGGP